MSATVPADRTTTEPVDVSTGLDPVDRELRKEAIASLKRKRRFVENVVTYVTVNGVIWLIWALTDRSIDGGLPWPAWISIVWGFLLAIDGWRAYGRWPATLHRPITEDDIELELRRSPRG